MDTKTDVDNSIRRKNSPLLALTLIPILDGIVVFKHADWNFKPAILIHWGTAAVMLVIVELLRSGM